MRRFAAQSGSSCVVASAFTEKQHVILRVQVVCVSRSFLCHWDAAGPASRRAVLCDAFVRNRSIKASLAARRLLKARHNWKKADLGCSGKRDNVDGRRIRQSQHLNHPFLFFFNQGVSRGAMRTLLGSFWAWREWVKLLFCGEKIIKKWTLPGIPKWTEELPFSYL